MELIEQYKKLYQQKDYGNYSIRYKKRVEQLINRLEPVSILDYGCGKAVLTNKLEKKYDIDFYRYEPALEQYEELPNVEVDLILAIEVLEHLENPIEILKQLYSLGKYSFLTISTIKAQQILPNGQNAHITVKPKEWWLGKIKDIFKIIEVQEEGVKFNCLVKREH